jgi:hypothetical protein
MEVKPSKRGKRVVRMYTILFNPGGPRYRYLELEEGWVTSRAALEQMRVGKMAVGDERIDPGAQTMGDLAE